MEMVFSSKRWEMLLTTNIAAVTSGANEQFERNYIIARDQNPTSLQPHHRSFHWSIHLFQSNQNFQAIEFVDCTVPEKLDIFRINLS